MLYHLFFVCQVEMSKCCFTISLDVFISKIHFKTNNKNSLLKYYKTARKMDNKNIAYEHKFTHRFVYKMFDVMLTNII